MNTNSSTQTRRPRPRLIVWIRRIILGLVITLVALSAIGAVYQAAGARSDQRDFPPPGQLYDVGGYRLHLYCTGPQETNNPTVILENLSGGTSANWGWIQPEIAKVTRTCSYDRAGWGWSDPGPHPQSLQQTVSDLHTLLEKAGIPGPYVLVGHSIGGIYVRKYAADYPDEVVGIVLVDSSHPDQYVRVPELQSENESYARISAIFPALARLGISRFYFAAGGEIDFGDLPPRQHDEVAAFWSLPEYFISQHAEVVAGPAIFAEAHTLGGLGDLPLAVVSQGMEPPAYWVELQNELPNLSSNSIHVTVKGSTHSSLALNREHAVQTGAAILQVVEAARAGRLLVSK
jgi:pimeloyl-ACP methyl ester carboxylesterase